MSVLINIGFPKSQHGGNTAEDIAFAGWVELAGQMLSYNYNAQMNKGNTSSGKTSSNKPGTSEATQTKSTTQNSTKIYKDSQGFWTNGKYRIDSKAMEPHTSGNYLSGKSQFKFGIDANKTVLDAANHSDLNGLWDANNKAKVFVSDGIVGYSNGQPTQWINVYRTNTGMVHGTPGNAPSN